MIQRIDVFVGNNKIGILAFTKEKRVAFQYTEDWVKNGFSINPFKLPLTNQVFISTSPFFKGLFGVFADSLPDSYGELLLDNYLKQKGINLNDLNCLDRLSYVGSSGMGLLEYKPDFSSHKEIEKINFDEIQEECNKLFESKKVNDIQSLFSLGGSSGGARPKSLIKYEGEDYLVKFTAKFDPKNISEIEFKYMSLAKEAGINVPEINLINGVKNKYFLIKRFDRVKDKRIHMISVAALLECDFSAPCLDYNDLIKLTWILTMDKNDVLEMYRRMVFNVLIDNQDDHAKNFSFLYDSEIRKYRLSPAYDITPSKTYYGEHTTSVNGKGKDITDQDMILVAEKNKISKEIAIETINQIKKVLKK